MNKKFKSFISFVILVSPAFLIHLAKSDGVNCPCVDIQCKETYKAYFGVDTCWGPLLDCWPCYHTFEVTNKGNFCSHTPHPSIVPPDPTHYCQPDTHGGIDKAGVFTEYECKNMGVCDEKRQYSGALTTCNGDIASTCH